MNSKTVEIIKKIIVFVAVVIALMGLMYPEDFSSDGPLVPAVALAIVSVYIWNRLPWSNRI
jgi:hypothetical protein